MFHKLVFLFGLLGFVFITSDIAAQFKPAIDKNNIAGENMIRKYLTARTIQLRDRCLVDIKSLEQWKKKRPIYKKQLLNMLGLDPLPKRTDLKATITGTAQHDDVIVENIHFQSLPGLYVTGNFYRPKKQSAPLPTILYLCGHGAVKKNGISYGNKVHYQHHGAWFARNGYTCLIIDSLQLGEIEALHHGTRRFGMWWWHSRGYTPAGVEAWNCIRALDYLETRKEVDAKRIGATGRSGGGAYSWWISAIDDRIKVAVPVAGITDLQNYVIDFCSVGHCDCMFMVNSYGWDFAKVAALVAPRPLLISNSDKDKIFPLDGVSRTHQKVRSIYRLHGAANNLGLHIIAGPHKDRQELRVHAFVWFDRYLKKKEAPIRKTADPLFTPSQLKVFKKLPSDQINTKIQETFVPIAKQPKIPENQKQWSQQKEQWLSKLRQQTFRSWPKKPVDLNLKKVFNHEKDGIRFAAYDFQSQQHIQLRLYVAHRAGLKKVKLTALHVLDEKQWKDFLTVFSVAFGDALKPAKLPPAKKISSTVKKMFRQNDWAMVYIAPRGIGLTKWNPSKTSHRIYSRQLALLGETIDQGRIWDVRRAIAAIRKLPELTKSFLWLNSSQEETSGIALYAALFEPNIQRLILTKPSITHDKGPYLLNVMRTLDMPVTVAMVAEKTRVVIQDSDPQHWGYPANVAKALKWPKNQLSFHSTVSKQVKPQQSKQNKK